IRGVVEGREVRIGSAAFILGKKQGATGTFVEIGGVVRGYFTAQSRYREGLRDVVGFFKKQNSQAWLLSGDNEREAAELAPLFDNPERLRFHQSPHDKLAFVQHLQQQGQRVLMIGDGLNDAGALQRSDVGIAVAENTNTFTPACDAILDASQFNQLPQFLTLARWGIQTVNRAYLLAAAYNAVGLSYAVSGTLSPVVAAILMPLSSVTIVLFGFGMTYGKARRLGL
ncbi:MAG: HAD-IC family P-type ATPase, partial [Saprospiraceae bacterium]|nr:HAD-IC family P-type ATPase [Saprospiraceae bacterium]